MKNCDTCNLCCSGYLIGSVDDVPFGNNTPCHKLLDGKCTIYHSRPNMCRNYYCAWSQGLFPEWMRPDKIGVVISVEIDALNMQYLKAVSKEDLDVMVIDEINNFVYPQNSYFVFSKVIPISVNV